MNGNVLALSLTLVNQKWFIYSFSEVHMKNMALIITISLTLSSTMTLASSQTRLNKISKNASYILEELTTMSDNSIPLSLLENAECVATIPNVMKIGFVFGVRHGEGLVSCRYNNSWSNPSFIYLTGGSWGPQIGIESVDLVLVFVRKNAVDKFSHDNFTLGADLAVSAGPLGRHAIIGTDYKLNSAVYSYSRARGLFLGLAIDGSSISIAHTDNATVYGANLPPSSILRTDGVLAPNLVYDYVYALQKFAK